MAVSRRLRYEVLRRDNHACRYCGSAAPDVTLTVDHVTPVALGGVDAAHNLVAACHDCNAGKSTASPDSALIDDVRADALRWSRAREIAAEDIRETGQQRIAAIEEVLIDQWKFYFEGVYGDVPPIGDGVEARAVIGQFLDRGLSIQDTEYLIMEIVLPARHVAWRNRWKYFAGCCWHRLREIDAAAQALIDNEDV